MTNQPNARAPSLKHSSKNETVTMIRDLWVAMTAMFGSRWTSQYGSQIDPAKQWSKTLDGVTYAQMMQGVDVLRVSGAGWPPTAGEFRLMCLAPNFPTKENLVRETMAMLRAEIGKDDLSPEAYYLVTKHLDLWELRRLDVAKARSRIESAYDAVRRDVATGQYEELPRPPKIEPPKAPSYDEVLAAGAVGEETLQSLKDLLG